MKKILYSSILCLIALLILPQISFAAGWPADSGVDISGPLLTGTPTYEPSGLIWHNDRNSLITVWAGLITEIDQSGSILHECYSSDPVKDWNCGTYYDFEGVTTNNSTLNYIYLGIENPDSIKEFDLSSGTYTGKTWDLTSWMTGADNSGLEGIAFIPNGYHPYANSSSGGLFYASLQATGEIFVFDVNLATSGNVTKVDQFTPVSGRIDASDLFFNNETELLYIMYDSADYMTEMRPDKTIINDYNSMPGSNEEGFTMKPSYPGSTATVFIGHDDSHNISLHNNYPVSYPIIDNDGDGYASDVDCNDNDASIYENRNYYHDIDLDSFGTGSLHSVCSGVGTPSGYSLNATDCNDASATTYQNLNVYNDADGDGYGTGSIHAVCSGAGTPSSHSANNTDCDDNNAGINAAVTYYRDADGDGFGLLSSTTAVCSMTAPEGYATNYNDANDNDFDNDGYETGIDCDDNNASLTVNNTYYLDNDNDLYGVSTGTVFCANSAPSGYVINNTDCNDNNDTVFTNITLYKDNDGDNLGNANDSIVECILEKSSYVTNSDDVNDNDYDNDNSETGIDCNDRDSDIFLPVIYYQDADGDGLGNKDITASICSNTAPAGYVTNSDDINDNDPTNTEPPEEQPMLVVTIEGRYIYINNEKIKLFNETPKSVEYEVVNYYNDGYTEIIVVGLFTNRATIVTLQVNNNDYSVQIVKKEVIRFKQKRTALSLKTKLNINKFITRFNDKKIIWKIKKTAKFSQVK